MADTRKSGGLSWPITALGCLHVWSLYQITIFPGPREANCLSLSGRDARTEKISQPENKRFYPMKPLVNPTHLQICSNKLTANEELNRGQRHEYMHAERSVGILLL